MKKYVVGAALLAGGLAFTPAAVAHATNGVGEDQRYFICLGLAFQTPRSQVVSQVMDEYNMTGDRAAQIVDAVMHDPHGCDHGID